MEKKTPNSRGKSIVRSSDAGRFLTKRVLKPTVIRDVLIARTVKRAGALLVTDNLRDFKIISRYCNVRIIGGKDFFSR